MLEAVMVDSTTLNVGARQAFPTNCVKDEFYESGYSPVMLDTDELLARLEERGIRNVQIAKALGLPDSRIPEIRRKERALKLDEAVKLVRAFELEQGSEAEPLHPKMIRLSVLYVAAVLGVPLERTEAQMEDIVATLRAFSLFVADPKVRRSVEAAEGFFQAMILRPRSGSEALPGNDPAKTH